MATTTINSQEDGSSKHSPGIGNTSWDTVHDASAGHVDHDFENPSSDILGPLRNHASFFGTYHNLTRVFLAFDVSSITTAPDSATLNLYVVSKSGSFTIHVVKSFHGDSIDHNDYNMLCDGGCSSGFDDEDLTEYSSLFGGSITAGQYNTWTLNSTAISDIVSADTLYIALLEDNDYNDSNPGTATSTTSHGINFRGQNHSSGSPPYLELTTVAQGKILLSSGKVTLSSGKITF